MFTALMRVSISYYEERPYVSTVELMYYFNLFFVHCKYYHAYIEHVSAMLGLYRHAILFSRTVYSNTKVFYKIWFLLRYF